MRSLTVPVSFSSLLFPTVPRCLSLSSLPTFLSVVCGFEGTGAGCWNSCGCANAGATTIISPIRPESTRRRCIPFWLTIDNSNYLPGDLHSSSKRDDPVSIMLGPNLDSLDGERVLPSRKLKAGLRSSHRWFRHRTSTAGQPANIARPRAGNYGQLFFLSTL